MKKICTECLKEGTKEFPAEEILGGHIIYVLNHPKASEYKYNCCDVVNNNVYQTSEKSDFLNYLRGILND